MLFIVFTPKGRGILPPDCLLGIFVGRGGAWLLLGSINAAKPIGYAGAVQAESKHPPPLSAVPVPSPDGIEALAVVESAQ